jgi:hypothetical protein
MTRAALAAALILVALGVSWLLRRGASTDAPTQVTWKVPQQLDRSRFAGPDQPWLVVLFSSETCQTCALMSAKVAVLASSDVAVDIVEHGSRPGLHTAYDIAAVPMTLVADVDGVVRASFVGPVSATDLWAAVAEVRYPGSSPEPGLGQTAD